MAVVAQTVPDPLESLFPKLDGVAKNWLAEPEWLLHGGAPPGGGPAFWAAARSKTDRFDTVARTWAEATAVVFDAIRNFMTAALWPVPASPSGLEAPGYDVTFIPLLGEIIRRQGARTFLDALVPRHEVSRETKQHARLTSMTRWQGQEPRPFVDVVVRHIVIERLARAVTEGTPATPATARRLGGLRTPAFLGLWPRLSFGRPSEPADELAAWKTVLHAFVASSPLTQLIYLDLAGIDQMMPSPLVARPSSQGSVERWTGRLADSLVAAVASAPSDLEERTELNIREASGNERTKIDCRQRTAELDKSRGLRSRSRLAHVSQGLEADADLHLGFLERWYALVLAQALPRMNDRWQEWDRAGELPQPGRLMEIDQPAADTAIRMLAGSARADLDEADARTVAKILQLPAPAEGSAFAQEVRARLGRSERFEIPLGGRLHATRPAAEILENWGHELAPPTSSVRVEVSREVDPDGEAEPAYDPTEGQDWSDQ